MEHWKGALQRIRVSLLPQVEGMHDPCGANFVINFDIEQRKTTPKGKDIFRTSTFRFANFRAMPSSREVTKFGSLGSPSNSADESEATSPRGRATARVALGNLVETVSHEEESSRQRNTTLDQSPLLQLVEPSLGGIARCCALAFVGPQEDLVDETIQELKLLRSLARVQNEPTSRGFTSTLMQEQLEEKVRVVLRGRREGKEEERRKGKQYPKRAEGCLPDIERPCR